MNQTRPTFSGVPAIANYGTVMTLPVKLPANTRNVTASLLDLGFSTHSIHMDMR